MSFSFVNFGGVFLFFIRIIVFCVEWYSKIWDGLEIILWFVEIFLNWILDIVSLNVLLKLFFERYVCMLDLGLSNILKILFIFFRIFIFVGLFIM